MKKKIAVIGTRGIPATYGGIEKHCEDLYCFLTQMGYEVTIYGRSYYLKEKLSEYKSVRIKNVPVLEIKGVETFMHSFVSTLAACFSDADIIHFHAQGPCLFSWIPKILAPQKKIAFTCHGIDWQRDKWGKVGKSIIKLGEKASAAFPDLRICVSSTLADYYKNKYKVDVKTINNGVHIKEKRPQQNFSKRFGLPEKGYLLFVGRMVPEKAPDMLIKAFRESGSDKKLVLAGGAAGAENYYTYLKELAGNDERIIFTDYVYGADIQELYSNSLGYISASKLEGLPITVLEAMSYSLPIVLSDIPPHEEIMQLNPNMGISFKTNDFDSCKNAIESFSEKNFSEVENMGNLSLKVVQDNFNWDKIASFTDQAYKSCF